jgi:hypothetical protein
VSREEVQVFFVLDLPACLGELLVDIRTGARLCWKEARTIRITHGVAKAIYADLIFARDPSAAVSVKYQSSAAGVTACQGRLAPNAWLQLEAVVDRAAAVGATVIFGRGSCGARLFCGTLLVVVG